MGHSVRLKLSVNGLTVESAKYYTTLDFPFGDILLFLIKTINEWYKSIANNFTIEMLWKSRKSLSVVSYCCVTDRLQHLYE